MSKYSDLSAAVLSVFGTVEWALENLSVFPSDYIKPTNVTEFIRLSIIPSGSSVNIQSVSGVVIFDIFFVSGNGPQRGNQIADILDKYLATKTRTISSGRVVQFSTSNVQPLGKDPENPNLSRIQYTIPFSLFGVL